MVTALRQLGEKRAGDPKSAGTIAQIRAFAAWERESGMDRQLIGDTMLLATLGLIAAIIAGAV